MCKGRGCVGGVGWGGVGVEVLIHVSRAAGKRKGAQSEKLDKQVLRGV